MAFDKTLNQIPTRESPFLPPRGPGNSERYVAPPVYLHRNETGARRRGSAPADCYVRVGVSGGVCVCTCVTACRCKVSMYALLE